MTDLSALPPEATLPPRINFVAAEASATDKPNHPRASLEAMRKTWDLPDLLLGGTPAMHAAGTKVLHQEEGEADADFKVRLGRGVLTNYYGDTIDRHSALPFRTPIKFDPPLPDPLAYLEHNCDGSGRSITVLAREVMREAMHRGLSHLLVDAAPTDPGAASLADDMTRRPLLLHIKPDHLLDAWDEPAASADGEDQVVYARIMQSRLVEDGRFGKAVEEFVLELDPGQKVAMQWVAAKNGEWSATESVYQRDSIPLFTFYTDQVDAYQGRPAYRYLAELNLAHFQSDCEQRHGLSYGRRSTLVKTGWKDRSAAQKAAAGQSADPATNNRLGFGRQIVTDSETADAKFLETGGAGLAAGQVDLTELEKRMERFGAAQVSREGGITATSRALDDKRDNCNLEAWCTRLEGRLLAAIRAIAAWRKVTLPANQTVTFDRSFSDNPTAAQSDLPWLIQMTEKRMLPRTVLLDEVRARKVLRTAIDNDEIVRLLAEEEDRFAEASMQAIAEAQVAARNQMPPDQTPEDHGQGAPQPGAAP